MKSLLVLFFCLCSLSSFSNSLCESFQSYLPDMQDDGIEILKSYHCEYSGESQNEIEYQSYCFTIGKNLIDTEKYGDKEDLRIILSTKHNITFSGISVDDVTSTEIVGKSNNTNIGGESTYKKFEFNFYNKSFTVKSKSMAFYQIPHIRKWKEVDTYSCVEF